VSISIRQSKFSNDNNPVSSLRPRVQKTSTAV
jgi:hypothetical protein